MIGMALMAVLMCVNFTSCSKEDDDFSSGVGINIPKNTIRYQTTDGSHIRLENEDVFGGAKIVKHTYSADNWWVMEFESDVTAIEDDAFFNNETLLSIILPNSVKTIGEDAFQNCDGLTSVTIGSGVKSIGEGAFYGCDRLTSVTIPNSVKTIGERAFKYCDGLTSVTIPNSVTSIGHGAFSCCDGLTSVTIGSGVTSIGDEAFAYCDGLTNIYVRASTPAKTEGSLGCEDATLYVPKGSLEAYKAADGWKEFENIQEWDAK